MREKLIEGEIEEILTEVNEKLTNIKTYNAAYKEDYALYSAMRMNYKKAVVKKDLSYDEGKILGQIWNSCLSLSK